MKQFTKFRQFADKAFVRPERTEVLSEDLQDAERRIDFIKQTCEVTGKKIQGCLQGQLKEGTPIEKRIRKVPEFVLGSSMLEFGGKLGHESILGEVLEETGKIEMKLGHETVAYEVKVDSVLSSLQNVIENELPSIYKLKRALGKLTENMDSAKSKLAQASRHSGPTTTGGKIDTAKDELEECQQKVEQCRDNLASEMYQLIAKESDIAQNIVQFLKHQQEYHLNVSNILQELLPEVDTILASSHYKPVYGTDLIEHLNGTGRTIAYPLELCVCGLLETALEEEGLFRIAGSSSKVKKLKSAFNAGLVDLKGLVTEFSDPHVIGTALKSYFRELPQPLLTFGLYKDWLEAIKHPESPEVKLSALKKVVEKLPTGNHDNLRYFIKFLKLLTDHQDSNKMSSANIAIVIGPNVLWSPNVGDGDGMNMQNTHMFSSIVDYLVSNCDYFFPDDIDFYVTWDKPTEQDLLATANRKTILNGTTTLEDLSSCDDGHMNIKRSQSNSSLDDQQPSPPQQNGSPKPIIRRNKGKPAPLPPSLGPTRVPAGASEPPRTPTGIDRTGSPSQGLQKSQGVSVSRVESTKREGVWIPPSPSQTYNRKSVFLHGPGGGTGAGGPTMSSNNKPSLGPPPKPPQPNLSKVTLSPEESPSAPAPIPFSGTNIVPSALRPKSSFRTPNKFENENKPLTPKSSTNESSTSGSNFSSLPRHFQTENSYKAKTDSSTSPRPKSIFSANPDPAPQPIDHIPKLTTFSAQQPQTKTENQSLYKSSGREMSPAKDPPTAYAPVNPINPEVSSSLIGFENIEQEIKIMDPPQAHPRPVPAPRSSLYIQHSGNEFDDLSAHRGAAGERPAVKAKPRDLTGKRSQTNIESTQPQNISTPVKTHSRNSSTDSDVPITMSMNNNNKSESGSSGSGSGSSTSSQPQSRTNSRNDTIQPQPDSSSEKKYSIPRPDRLSIGSEDEFEGVGNEMGPAKGKGPSRPPRPQPPPPPTGNKKAGTPGESTDL